jgi:AefR-like transcriptional repressor, C-terminal domain
MRSWRPFCCGLPGLMRSMRMPSLNHHTDSLLQPKKALRLAKGMPLSVGHVGGQRDGGAAGLLNAFDNCLCTAPVEARRRLSGKPCGAHSHRAPTRWPQPGGAASGRVHDLVLPAQDSWRLSWLDTCRGHPRAGDIKHDDPHMAAEYFISMIKAGRHIPLIFNQPADTRRASIRKIAAGAVEIFLNGVAKT